jgi:hypothetical protein
MDKYLSEVGKRLKGFNKKSTRQQNLMESEVNKMIPKDTRNASLKELDLPSEELNKYIGSKRKGEFSPKEEKDLEDKVEQKLQNNKEDKERYLELLRKRMRTA